MKTTSIIVLTFLLLAGCDTSEPEPSGRNGLTLPEGVVVDKNIQVTMRDGARLNTHVLLPKGGTQPVATILIRTPYKSELDSRSGLPARLLSEGYAIVHQHERGRFFSEGQFEMLGGAVEDGWDTMDWIVAQGWSNGTIGTMGCSSSGENQLKLAAAGHPAHKAMVAQSVGVGVAEAGPFKEQGNFWRGGVWQQGWSDYFIKSMFQNWPQLPAGLTNEERQRTVNMFDLTSVGWEVPAAAFNGPRMHLPMVDISEAMNMPQNELEAYLRAGPNHPSWAENRVSEGEIIKVPGFWAEAIYDLSGRSTLAYFEWNRRANAEEGRTNQVMRVTQGGHCSFGGETENTMIGDLALGDLRYDYVNDVVAWFDRWLKPETPAGPMPPTYQAYLGNGDWLEADALPMTDGMLWHLDASGTLSDSAPLQPETISFVYDPADPVPSVGGEIGGTGDDHEDGGFDQRAVEARDDVIVFTSAPLKEDMDLFGLAEVGLTVSSDRPDTDFTVKLVDVYPDGRAFNIGDTILRMRHRNGVESVSFMEAGQQYDITLPPILLSRRIEKGHQLRVQVSSSNFPTYARNLNTDQDPYTSTDTAIANNTVHVGAGFQSYIRLPVHKPNT